jgi:hypothetical protein
MICQTCKDRVDEGDRVHEPCKTVDCPCQHGEPYAHQLVDDGPDPIDGHWRDIVEE